MNDALDDLYENETGFSIKFMEPHRFIYKQARPVIRDEEWMHGTYPDRDSQDGHVALSLTAYFGGLMLQTFYNEEEC